MAAVVALLEGWLEGLQHGCFWLRDALGWNDLWFVLIFSIVINDAVYVACNLYYYIISTIPYCRRYKVQPTKEVTREEVLAALSHCIKGRIIYRWPAGHILLRIWKYQGGTLSGPLPSLGQIAVQLLLILAFEDTYYYWVHRACHYGPLYRMFHKKHHEITAPIVLMTEWGTPFEEVVVNMGSSLLFPSLMGVHILVYWAWVIYRTWESAEVHCGYALPWHFSTFLPYAGGPAFHDFHHEFHTKGCYGSYFWDWAMGTDQHFNNFQSSEKKRERQAVADKMADGRASIPLKPCTSTSTVAGTPDITPATSTCGSDVDDSE